METNSGNAHDVEVLSNSGQLTKRSKGFRAVPEVGEAGYRIDIGVKHPEYPGYIMAVETDGATYHSSYSARDRDILRQEILEGMGGISIAFGLQTGLTSIGTKKGRSAR